MLVMSNHLLCCIKSLCLGVKVGREGVNSDLLVFFANPVHLQVLYQVLLSYRNSPIINL